MSSSKFKSRKFVSVDPLKCTGCGICEYACTLEKGEKAWNPIRSRIRVVRMSPLFNFALACRFCEDAKCVDACPEDALNQSEDTGILMVNDKRCMGCDWCIQACPHGGITLHTDTGKAIACDLCDDEPSCVEFCPEDALEIVLTDEDAEKRFNTALEKLPEATKHLTETVKTKNWKPLINEAEVRSLRVTEKLEALNKKANIKKNKKQTMK
ncbi:MAG: 4Fe-4S dicluster domain-containing protein [Candidatus Bathyarchaeota archaeon]|jgi:Fe-S-cluster-containing hydrogenase component 2|nr:4Fe-4S dicluster domain-containing protein [Candidatus Bathyarchaeota archaeon]